MVKFNTWRNKTLIYYYYLKGLTFSQSPNPNPLFQQYPSSLFSLHFCTNTSDYSTPFPVSYLIQNCGFSPQTASKLCSTYRLRFNTAKKPDSVLAFFRNHGFSETQLRNIIAQSPQLLSCDPSKRVLPKFQFFLSKGASNSDIVNLASKNPRILNLSVENHIVPIYELLRRFLQSEEDADALAIHKSYLLSCNRVPDNITMLVENGVRYSSIVRLLRTNSRVFLKRDMLKLVEELKNFGFNPSKTTFGIALEAKLTVHKTLWEEKVDTFKKWGWSDEDVLEAFRRQPHCMLVSINKINLLMSFWVNQMGWDVLALAKGPLLFSMSVEKRIIPRALVVQFLLKKGLREEKSSLASPFIVSDKKFRDKFINRYEEESSYLLKLYEEKLTLAHTREGKN
ncbi:transcription termination factor MTERF5, chloroplastic [Trifolium repens]|nr:transcription termination factor MTERF5, chloroplastic [Trifolium repens]